MNNPLPWRVVYNPICDEWHRKSCPSIVDAKGNETGVTIRQFGGHPGAYDIQADEMAHRIVDAVNQADEWVLTDFQRRLAWLDAALTGKDWQTIQHTARNAKASPEKLCLDSPYAYYLSDGGYSRIYCNPETSNLFLGSESLDRVKAAWTSEVVQPLIESVRSSIAQWLTDNGV